MRKQGKKLAVFDIKLEVAWTGQMGTDGTPVDGTIKISEFATGSDHDDWVLQCTTKEAKNADAVRSLHIPSTLWITCPHVFATSTRTLHACVNGLTVSLLHHSWHLMLARSFFHRTCAARLSTRRLLDSTVTRQNAS